MIKAMVAAAGFALGVMAVAACVRMTATPEILLNEEPSTLQTEETAYPGLRLAQGYPGPETPLPTRTRVTPSATPSRTPWPSDVPVPVAIELREAEQDLLSRMNPGRDPRIESSYVALRVQPNYDHFNPYGSPIGHPSHGPLVVVEASIGPLNAWSKKPGCPAESESGRSPVLASYQASTGDFIGASVNGVVSFKPMLERWDGATVHAPTPSRAIRSSESTASNPRATSASTESIFVASDYGAELEVGEVLPDLRDAIEVAPLVEGARWRYARRHESDALFSPGDTLEVRVDEARRFGDHSMASRIGDYWSYISSSLVGTYDTGEYLDVLSERPTDHAGIDDSGFGMIGSGCCPPLLALPVETSTPDDAPTIVWDNARTIRLLDRIATTAGQFEGCWEIEDRLNSSAWTSYWVCPGVGLVRMEDVSCGSMMVLGSSFEIVELADYHIPEFNSAP